MYLTLDIGNTRAKAAIFEEGAVVAERCFQESGAELAGAVEAWARERACGAESAGGELFRAIALSSTRRRDRALEQFLERLAGRLVVVDRNTPVPLGGLEGAPQTLGADRLAAAVGAATVFGGRDVLIVDFGTAITVDSVTRNGEYRYGVISPGARARFESLNRLTDNLPLCSLEEADSYAAGTTRRSIADGVVNGIVHEIEGYIRLMGGCSDDFVTVFSGGDAKFFRNKIRNRIKNTIFAELDLIFIGLHRIIEYNAAEKIDNR